METPFRVVCEREDSDLPPPSSRENSRDRDNFLRFSRSAATATPAAGAPQASSLQEAITGRGTPANVSKSNDQRLRVVSELGGVGRMED